MNYKALSEFNPFERLEFYDPYGFEYEGQGVFSLFVATAISRGISYASSELNFRTKKAYLSKLREKIGSQKFNYPSKIYSELFGEVYKRFLERLQKLFDAGQEKGILVFNSVEV